MFKISNSNIFHMEMHFLLDEIMKKKENMQIPRGSNWNW